MTHFSKYSIFLNSIKIALTHSVHSELIPFKSNMLINYIYIFKPVEEEAHFYKHKIDVHSVFHCILYQIK